MYDLTHAVFFGHAVEALIIGTLVEISEIEVLFILQQNRGYRLETEPFIDCLLLVGKSSP